MIEASRADAGGVAYELSPYWLWHLPLLAEGKRTKVPLSTFQHLKVIRWPACNDSVRVRHACILEQHYFHLPLQHCQMGQHSTNASARRLDTVGCK